MKEKNIGFLIIMQLILINFIILRLEAMVEEHVTVKHIMLQEKSINMIKMEILLKNGKTQRAAEYFGITPSDIHRVCKNKEGVTQTHGYQWSYTKHDKINRKIKQYTGKKKILQLDSDFNIVSEYSNVSCIDSKIFNRERVTNCCNFRAITHNGYYWVYEELFNKDTVNKILNMKNKKHKDVLSKLIYQLDSNKNIVNVYKNSKEASDKTGINRNTIQAYCKRNIANHGFNTTGYYWLYEYET